LEIDVVGDQNSLRSNDSKTIRQVQMVCNLKVSSVSLTVLRANAQKTQSTREPKVNVEKQGYVGLEKYTVASGRVY
jgi:hypothetical protein